MISNIDYNNMVSECLKEEKDVIEYILSFRQPMLVIDFKEYWNHNCYPICPRCNQCLNREYLNYCYMCGQKLSWKGFKYKYNKRKK